jgi:hypothetical protein
MSMEDKAQSSLNKTIEKELEFINQKWVGGGQQAREGAEGQACMTEQC